MKVPTRLSHKPIFGLDDYHLVDGVHDKATTNAKALSVGFSQYNDTHISAKVFRRDARWSPQSEELPLHRTFDLANITLKAILMSAGVDVPETETINPRVVDSTYKEWVKEYYLQKRGDILPKIKELRQVMDWFIEHEELVK
ncbi:MAG: DUF6530 family protein [Rikenellaceae bacterium]